MKRFCKDNEYCTKKSALSEKIAQKKVQCLMWHCNYLKTNVYDASDGVKVRWFWMIRKAEIRLMGCPPS